MGNTPSIAVSAVSTTGLTRSPQVCRMASSLSMPSRGVRADHDGQVGGVLQRFDLCWDLDGITALPPSIETAATRLLLAPMAWVNWSSLMP